jgi:hypothetical protein
VIIIAAVEAVLAEVKDEAATALMVAGVPVVVRIKALAVAGGVTGSGSSRCGISGEAVPIRKGGSKIGL